MPNDERSAPLERNDVVVPLLYVARWYVSVRKSGKKRVRRYLSIGNSAGRYTWLADPRKALAWNIEDAARAHELAEHFKCDVVKLGHGI